MKLQWQVIIATVDVDDALFGRILDHIAAVDLAELDGQAEPVGRAEPSFIFF